MQNGFKHPPEKEDFKRISSIRIIARDSYIYIFGTHPDIAYTAVLPFAPHLDFCELQQSNVSHLLAKPQCLYNMTSTNMLSSAMV